MRNAFCATVLNKGKWVLKLSKNGILLPTPISHLHLGTGEYHTYTQKHHHLNKKVNNNLKEQA